jgi:hypothetical protein
MATRMAEEIQKEMLRSSLSSVQKNDFLKIVHMNRFDDGGEASKYSKVNELLDHYRKGKAKLLEEPSIIDC